VSGDALELGEIAASVGSQLASAEAALRAGTAQLRLIGMALRFQGAVTVMDNSLGLDFSAPASGSAVDLTFHGAEVADVRPTPVTIPDVSGYTRALARRKMEAAGLRVAISAKPEAAGRVIETRPSAGTQALSGTVVLVVVQ
jgi:hypothetical protein